MIVEWFVAIGAGIAEFFAGLMPGPDEFVLPPELVGIDQTVSDFFDGFSGLGVWVPWVLLAGCISIAVTAWLLGIGIKVLRTIASHVPFFGGSG